MTDSDSTHNAADVDEIHLTAVAPVRRVNNDAAAVWADSWMGIATPFAFIFGGRMKASKGDLLGGGDIVKVDLLFSLSVRICVVQYPLIGLPAPRGPWKVAAMSVLSHDFLADNLNPVRAVLVKIERVSVGRVPGPGKDMAIVSPDKVRGSAVVVHNLDVRTVRFGGEHSCAEASLALGSPAMQEYESRTIGIEK